MNIYNEENETLSKELFIFLKYNQIPTKNINLSEEDERLFDEFNKKK